MITRCLSLLVAVLLTAAGQSASNHAFSAEAGSPSPGVKRSASSIAAEQRVREMETVTALTAEGRALYAADEQKHTGYEYCRQATTFALAGEFRRAVREASKALYLGQAERNEDLLAHAKRDLAIAYSYAGQTDRAQIYAEEALKHAVGQRNRNAVHTWAHKVLGDVALRRGDPKGAIARYERSVATGEGSMRFFARVSLANAHVAAGDLARAADAVRQAAGYLDVLDGRTRAGAETSLLRTRGNLALKEGKPAEAQQFFSQALERSTEGDREYQQFWALEGRARAELAQNDRQAALKSYLAALDASEKVRARFRSEEISSGLFGEMQHAFDEAVSLQMQAGTAEAAWETSERGRARALLDLVRNRVKLASGTDVFADPLGQPAGLKDVQARLEPGEAIVQFHVLPGRTFVWVIRGSSVTASTVEIERAELVRLVDGLRTAVSQQQPGAREAGKKLYEALLRAPLGPLKDVEALVVVPHDVLHYAPFQALHDGEKFLIERFMLSYAPSGSALSALLADGKPGAGKLLGLADPDIGPQFALPGAQREMEAIRPLFPEHEVYVRRDATKRRLLGSVQNAGTLHIAAHAEVDAVDPLYSRIHLAPDGARPGSLEAHEVYGISLKHARMVVLSACETGLGKVSRGDEIWGFTRSFLSAGTPTLLVTLWAVADDSTERLMASFYRAMGTGSARAALRNAQLELIKGTEYAHPYHWAPFNLIGNWK